jgi:4-carboxymuconolactone decarboxylase
MRLSRPRIDPVPESEWTDEIREVLPRGAGTGRVANVFTTFARHPKLLKRWLVFGSHVLGKSSLPAREREILILRIGWLCRCEYERGQHVVIGRTAGLSDDELRRITQGPEAAGWAPFDATLLTAVDELRADAMISDKTWTALAGRYDTLQLLDLVFTVGQYTLVSMALNTLGVQLDDGIEGFPK